MGRRRQPLILERTAEALSTFNTQIGYRHDHVTAPSFIKLQSGLLLLPPESAQDHQALWQYLESQGVQSDESNLIGLSASTLRRLSLCSGSWILVKHVRTKVGRPAKVVVLDPPGRLTDPTSQACHRFDGFARSFLPTFTLQAHQRSNPSEEIAYLSPLLAFNLGLHVSWLELWLSCSSIDYKGAHMGKNLDDGQPCLEVAHLEGLMVEVSSLHQVLPFQVDYDSDFLMEQKENVKQNPLKHASHVRIGHVKVPNSGVSQYMVENGHFTSEERQDKIDNALHAYFKCGRVLTRGDIFAVQIQPETKIQCSTSNDSGVIFFKVIAMEPETEPFLWVNCKQTALILGDSAPSQLPPSILKLFPEKQLPAWLAPVICNVTHLLAPSLHPRAPSLSLRTAILLCGPTGCGKRTVVKYAAEDLGMHVVEYNCHELIGSSEGKTVSALVQAFEVARRYAPSVLLLRRFEALGKTHISASARSDSGGAMSRVGTALRDSVYANLNTLIDEGTTQFLPEIHEDREQKFTVHFQGHKPGLVLVVATAESTETLTAPLRRCFTHEVTMKSPDEQQRSELLHHFLHPDRNCNIVSQQKDLKENEHCPFEQVAKSVAAQTAGAVPRDLQAIVADAGASTILKILEECRISRNEKDEAIELPGVTCEGVFHTEQKIEVKESSGMITDSPKHIKDASAEQSLSVSDLEKSFECFKSRTATALGAPKVPNVKWEDVGGLEDCKKVILDTVQLPLLHRNLFASEHLPQRSGVLLYGPPGTGKTLLAKAVATECLLNFLSVKGPELINMYIGESEKNVRDIFQKARSARPCVIFFDELDALAPARGASGDSGGVMDRVVSQMLAEIDGLNKGQQDLFIIGATNRPDLIDPALLRPGRFDKLLYVGISSDVSYRQRVLEALTRKFKLKKDVSLESIARMCPATFTGADLYALCADAWKLALKRKVFMVANDEVDDLTAEEIVVEHEDFTEALQELTPSLSEAELMRYEKMRAQFEG